MNVWQLEKMAETRRQEIRRELARIHLEKLAAQGNGSSTRTSRPLLFKLGSGRVALGRQLRKRGASRGKDYWAAQSDWTAEHP